MFALLFLVWGCGGVVIIVFDFINNPGIIRWSRFYPVVALSVASIIIGYLLRRHERTQTLVPPMAKAVVWAFVCVAGWFFFRAFRALY